MRISAASQNPHRRLTSIFVLVFVCTLLISCSPSGANMTTTGTQAEATTQLQSLLDDAVAALPAGAKLEEILLPGFPTSKCDETSDPHPSGLVFVGNSWWLRGLPVSANADTFTALRNHWKATGWMIDTDQSPNFLNAKRAGYGISIGANSKNELTIGASSPCVTPSPAQ